MTIKTAHSAKGEITLYTITNGQGASVTLSTLGAGIVSIQVPDKDGKLEDVVLGYENPADFLYDGPCAGKIPGRFANRINNGRFTLDGKEYYLARNTGGGKHALHGGPEGFQNQLWTARVVADNAVEFTYVSADGEEGYPGTLTARATYVWSDNNELTLTLEAETDAKTVVNLTNHVYFNLGGHNKGSMTGHKLWIKASHYLPTDEGAIPTGELAPVAGTPMDFTSPKAIGRDMYADFEALNIGKGYDHCWVIDDYEPGKIQHMATLCDPVSGRSVEISTTQPGVQIYGGNWLAGCPEGKDGAKYNDYAAVALECQGFPDAPNKPAFPSAMLVPGEKYNQVIKFSFKK